MKKGEPGTRCIKNSSWVKSRVSLEYSMHDRNRDTFVYVKYIEQVPECRPFIVSVLNSTISDRNLECKNWSINMTKG